MKLGEYLRQFDGFDPNLIVTYRESFENGTIYLKEHSLMFRGDLSASNDSILGPTVGLTTHQEGKFLVIDLTDAEVFCAKDFS